MGGNDKIFLWERRGEGQGEARVLGRKKGRTTLRAATKGNRGASNSRTDIQVNAIVLKY